MDLILIAVCLGPPKGVDVRWSDLSIFTWEKNRIQNSVERIWLLLFKYCLKKRVQISDEYVSYTCLLDEVFRSKT